MNIYFHVEMPASISHINPEFPIFPQLDGVFVLNKPSGPSSAQCLKIFKKFGQKKIGHAGTLDPLASGVLLVLMGQATKLAGYLQSGGEKIYKGILRLGVETDTWDSQGNVVAEKPWEHISRNDVESQIHSWLNMTEQEIPPYSAAKHCGQPLYKLARKGLETPVKKKVIKISRADISDIDMPYVHFRVSCSSGSYIRSLAHSLGKRLGCGAALCGLVREYSHPFNIETATTPDELRDNPSLLRERLLPLKRALPDWPVVQLMAEDAAKVKNGSPITAAPGNCGFALLCQGEKPIALAKAGINEKSGMWTVLRGLWSDEKPGNH